jgi:para-aminobenzoate synthetase / 4-amino-4-deoxychorismate lyase
MTASDWRPDPAKGIFETLLVVDGEPVELEGHLARLGQSLAAVYAKELPPQAEDELREAAKGLALGRVRFTVVPAEDGLRHDLLAGWVVPETVFPVRGVKLRTQHVCGGNGPHKWVDRRNMEHPDGGPGQLICDGDELLEAGWANLFAVREETLWTPPADGRILPGRARAALLEIADEENIPTAEQPLHAQELYKADEVFLTNSIRCIEPAAELDQEPLPGCGPVSSRLAAALRRRWRLEPQAAAAAQRADQLSH